MLKIMVLSSLLLFSGLALASESVDSDIPVLDTQILMTVLDTGAPLADREAAMASLKQSAEAGNSFAMYDLGSL